MRHPVMVFGFAWWTVLAVGFQSRGTSAIQRFESVTAQLSFFPGVVAVLAGHLLATRDRRAGTTDLLDTLPASARQRVLALCAAALVPAAVAAVLNLALTGYFIVTGGFVETPDIWQVLQAPVTVLGGTLLGVLIGVWLPSRAAPVMAIIVVVAINVWLVEHGSTGALFAPMFSWVDWGPYDGSRWVRTFPGSTFAHDAYLIGLCGMAAAGAVLRVAEHRAIPLLAGVVAATVAVVGGVAQLP